MVKWIRIIYLIIAWLFPVAILVQVLFVGLSLFTGQSYWDAHIGFGHSIGILPILLVILGYLGRLPRRTIILTWLALGTYLVQAEVFAAIRADAPFFAAFHPVLALVLFALAVIIALRARTMVRVESRASSKLEPPASIEEQGSLASDRVRGG
ncbi:MAG TPA: DUF6220 domain-containing protein [Ktedonobacteraceae bacterium]